MFRSDPKNPLVRSVAAVAGLILVSFGLRALRWGGDLHYQNWFGELVFAPIAVVLGITVVVGAVFKPEILRSSSTRHKR